MLFSNKFNNHWYALLAYLTTYSKLWLWNSCVQYYVAIVMERSTYKIRTYQRCSHRVAPPHPANATLLHSALSHVRVSQIAASLIKFTMYHVWQGISSVTNKNASHSICTTFAISNRPCNMFLESQTKLSTVNHLCYL